MRHLHKLIEDKGLSLRIFAYRVGIMPKRIQKYLSYHDFSESERECIAKILDMSVDEVFNEEYRKEREKYREKKLIYDRKRRLDHQRPFLKEKIYREGKIIYGLAKEVGIDKLRFMGIVNGHVLYVSGEEKKIIASALDCEVEEIFPEPVDKSKSAHESAHKEKGIPE